MSTKPQVSNSNTASTAPAKQARSRKADTATTGRAGSAGGVLLEKEAVKKSSASPSATAPKSTPPKLASAPASVPPKDAQPKRKPRKLNKDPTTPSTPSLSNEAVELEALKSRVRGLEAKVEDLYKSAAPAQPTNRSPRRRGKGRKSSSATTTATLGNMSRQQDQDAQVIEIEDEEEADEELDRLETELEGARRDLALYAPQPQSRPRAQRTTSNDTEFVEEIPREAPGISKTSNRQVTLSGSYRIPLPATLNPEDVKTIQSGVSAAQNVARSFLDQRRANQALRAAQADAGPPPTRKPQAKAPAKAAPAAKDPAEDAQLSTLDGAGKQSWGEWIGGYSMAISRAVKTIEHEAAMEAQTSQAGQTRAAKGPAPGKKKKRPPPKTALSGEQVQGLMS